MFGLSNFESHVRIRLLLTAILVLTLHSPGSVSGQNTQLGSREQEWKSYVLPSTEFTRHSDGKTMLFRVPAAWQFQESDLSMSGPHSSRIQLFVEKIPDGLALRDYAAALTQQLQNQPGAEVMIIRRTQMSGIEAREILFQVPDVSRVMTHRVIWCTVEGPNAVSLVLITPSAHLQEIEPYFKAVVQSITILGESRFTEFEALRSETIKQTKPARVDEVQSLAETLNGLDQSGRKSSIEKLARVFGASPDSAIDLTMDRRAMIRAGAIEAIAQSQNPALDQFLLRALDDKEPSVAEQAARTIALLPNAMPKLREMTLAWLKTETLARVWPFLGGERRLEILREIFSEKAAPKSPATARRQNPEPLRPPLPVVGKVEVRQNARAITTIDAKPLLHDPSTQLGALALLRDVPVNEFRLPLAQVLAVNNDTLTRAALEVSLERREELSVELLLKLLSSSNNDLFRLAARNLAQSGKGADVALIEAQIDRLLKKAKPAAENGTKGRPDKDPVTVEDLRLAISEIRLREQAGSATSAEARRQIIRKALAEPKLAEWVWTQFVRDEREPSAASITRSVSVSPLAENLLPADPILYTAFPEPLKTYERLGSAFNAIQMDTAREQADLVLLMSALRQQLFTQLGAEPDSSPFDYLGVKGAAPAVFANWTAEGAPRGIASAVRRVVVLRVHDRNRFERSVCLYQRTIGDFERVTDMIGGGARFLGLLPGVIPMAAKLITEGAVDKPKDSTILRLGFVGVSSWGGHEIKVIAQDRIDSTGHIIRDAVYLTYLDDAAVLTPDMYSMRDVLTRAANDATGLAANPEFKSVSANGGDSIYLSDLPALYAQPGDRQELKVNESGALRITNSIWENIFKLNFPTADWSKGLLKFRADEITSARVLLPQTTFAYYMMKLDAAPAWISWKTALNAEDQQSLSSIWAVDLQRDVIPELGAECGVAVTRIPSIEGNNWDVPLLLFFQLKSDKLGRLAENGELFKGQSANSHMVRVRLGAGDWLAGVRAGFLVFANSEAAVTALDSREKLFNAPDFSKAVKRAPEGIVAFGGLNLDAAIAAITESITDPEKQRLLSAIFSVAKAFHSQNFYATAEPGRIDARFSALIGREGRYSVAELSSLSKGFGLTYAVVEAKGVPISNQDHLNSIRLRVRARATGEVDRIISDISSPFQVVEKKSDSELEVTIRPRLSVETKAVKLPITDPALAPFVQATNGIRSGDQKILEKAREIAGEDRDAWSVARKLSAWTYKNLKWKKVDYADAAQTLATREADCSEFSQLYVAMARSLGLPARMVSGLAYSGRSFGGHAWVEVYVGQWIELDPTFGTDFVDATHIRDSNGGFLTYAALNLVDLEVLDAPRGVADFQRDARTLVLKLCEQLPDRNLSALTAALDISLLTDAQMGQGSWAAMNDAEREQMTFAYRRLVLELQGAFASEKNSASSLRVLRINETADRAEVLLMHSFFGDFLERLVLTKRTGGWYIAELNEADTGLSIVSEILKPAVWEITDRRNGKPPRGEGATDLVRVLVALQRDPESAATIADLALKEDPDNPVLLYAKTLALVRGDKTAEAVAIWEKLASGSRPFAAAVLKLATHFHDSDKEEDTRRALGLFQKYVALEPEDPRGHSRLASIYDHLKDATRAEAEFREAVATDPSNPEAYVDLAEFLAVHQRYEEAVDALNESTKHGSTGNDPLGDLFERLMLDDTERVDVAEAIARAVPQRLTASAAANLNLARMRMRAGRPREALPLLQRAAEIEKKSSDAYDIMAECYRQLHNWPAAVSAANTAIDRKPEDAEAYYQRACALARLGRTRDAMVSLKRAVELDSLMAESIEEEADLKILSSMAAFKKLIADRDKQ